ncbi:MAG: orotidine-5'-phosphate decarboxylase [Nitrospinota bacterium]
MASELSPAERLIVALDVPTHEEAQQLVSELDDLVSFFKVGLELFTATGLDVVRRLIEEHQKKVLLDIKWLDIPETVAAVVRVASWLRVSFATIDGNGNAEMMMKAAVAAREGGVRLLCVTALTSWDDEVLREMGWQTTVEDLVEARVRRAMDAGLGGVVSSGREVAMIRRLAEDAQKELLIVTPGMRLPGSDPHDHKRPYDPESAIKDGADYIVVGRPIRDARDRKGQARRFIDAIAKGDAQRQVAANR